MKQSGLGNIFGTICGILIKDDKIGKNRKGDYDNVQIYHSSSDIRPIWGIIYGRKNHETPFPSSTQTNNFSCFLSKQLYIPWVVGRRLLYQM